MWCTPRWDLTLKELGQLVSEQKWSNIQLTLLIIFVYGWNQSINLHKLFSNQKNFKNILADKRSCLLYFVIDWVSNESQLILLETKKYSYNKYLSYHF